MAAQRAFCRHTHTLARTQPFQLRDFNAGALLGLLGVPRAAVSSVADSAGSVLVSLQKAGWATPGPATASSAWQSPRSTSGAWTTKAACSAVHCRALGCAGRSSKMPSSRWQSRPQVRPLVPCAQPPPHPTQPPRHSGPSTQQTLAFPAGLRAFCHGTWTASFDIN